MPENTLFISVYLLSGLLCLLTATALVCLKQLRQIRIRKYLYACRALALATGVVGAGDLLTSAVGGSELAELGMLAFPVLLVASSQSLLFTFLLTLLFREEYVTRRNIRLHALPTIVLTAAYLTTRCFVDDPAIFSWHEWRAQLGNPAVLVRSLFCLTYVVQLAVYTRLFFRQRAIYKDNLSVLDDIPRQAELRWVTRVFLYALGIGGLALTLCFCVSTAYELSITGFFAAFYATVGYHYVNYHTTYNVIREKLCKANAGTPPEKTDTGLDTLVSQLAQKRIQEADQKLFDQAERLMIEGLPFLDPHFNRKELVTALFTNEHYLTRAIRRHTARKSIQDYITYYRYNYAHTLLLIPDDPRPISVIAEDSGFSSVRTFNRCFKKLNKDYTPSEFRIIHQEAAQ